MFETVDDRSTSEIKVINLEGKKLYLHITK